MSENTTIIWSLSWPGDGGLAVGDGGLVVGDGGLVVGDGGLAVGDGGLLVGDDGLVGEAEAGLAADEDGPGAGVVSCDRTSCPCPRIACAPRRGNSHNKYTHNLYKKRSKQHSYQKDENYGK